MTDFSFVCSYCGQRHEGLPDLAFDAPLYWSAAAADSDPQGNWLDTDCCVVGGRDFFIRCVLLVPIRETRASFGWGVWLTQSRANFDDYCETFPNTPERAAFGFLANRLPVYPDTLNLRARAHWQPNGQRPLVELEPSDHPLFIDSRDGISRDGAIALYERTHHPHVN